MVSCLDFVNSIGYDNFKSSVTNYFDHMMAFYRICGTCEFLSISSITNNDLVDFNIIFANVKDASTLHYILNSSSNRTVKVFDRWFAFDTEEIDETTLRVKIYPCA